MAPLSQHLIEDVGTIRDDTVNAEVQETMHIGPFVDGPRVHLSSCLVNRRDKLGVDRDKAVVERKLVRSCGPPYRPAEPGGCDHGQRGGWPG